MRSTYSLSILLLLVLITSCGKSKSNDKMLISLNEEKLARLIDEQIFECDPIDRESCPHGLSRLIIYNVEKPHESSLCSGFLVKSNILVTNNHCVSTQIQCENTYISIYNGETVEKVRCDSIIHTEVDTEVLNRKKIDFTILKLNQKVPVRSFSLSDAINEKGDILKAWVVDHLSLKKVRLSELRCEVDSSIPFFKINNCPIIEGNSGSPLLNKYDEVVAVIWGSTVDTNINASFPMKERRSLKESAFATGVENFKDLIDLQ